MLKPSEIDIHKRLIGSKLQNRESELVATKIVKISLANGNEWKDFSFEDYKEELLSRHDDFEMELAILGEFVLNGLLDYENGMFSINEEFVARLVKN